MKHFFRQVHRKHPVCLVRESKCFSCDEKIEENVYEVSSCTCKNNIHVYLIEAYICFNDNCYNMYILKRS